MRLRDRSIFTSIDLSRLGLDSIVDSDTVVESSVVMGIGLALYEDVRYSKNGRLITNSFIEYKIPSRQDIYGIQVAFEQSYEPTGPFGAKSIGQV